MTIHSHMRYSSRPFALLVVQSTASDMRLHAPMLKFVPCITKPFLKNSISPGVIPSVVNQVHALESTAAAQSFSNSAREKIFQLALCRGFALARFAQASV